MISYNINYQLTPFPSQNGDILKKVKKRPPMYTDVQTIQIIS